MRNKILLLMTIFVVMFCVGCGTSNEIDMNEYYNEIQSELFEDMIIPATNNSVTEKTEISKDGKPVRRKLNYRLDTGKAIIVHIEYVSDKKCNVNVYEGNTLIDGTFHNGTKKSGDWTFVECQ